MCSISRPALFLYLFMQHHSCRSFMVLFLSHWALGPFNITDTHTAQCISIKRLFQKKQRNVKVTTCINQRDHEDSYVSEIRVWNIVILRSYCIMCTGSSWFIHVKVIQKNSNVRFKGEIIAHKYECLSMTASFWKYKTAKRRKASGATCTHTEGCYDTVITSLAHRYFSVKCYSCEPNCAVSLKFSWGQEWTGTFVNRGFKFLSLNVQASNSLFSAALSNHQSFFKHLQLVNKTHLSLWAKGLQLLSEQIKGVNTLDGSTWGPDSSQSERLETGDCSLWPFISLCRPRCCSREKV